MKVVVIVVLAMLVVAELMVQPNEAISCPEVDHLLEPCLPYLRSGGTPSTNCCNGLKTLQTETPAKSDRQTACNCAKIAAITFKIREDTAEDLPKKCGIVVSVPVSPTVDCSTVSLYASYK